MEEIRFSTVQEFNDHYGVPTLHPLVTVVRFDREVKLEEHMCHYGLYALFLKENKGCRLSYGRTEYDFNEMTVTSFAPGQSIHVEPNPEVPVPKWTALLFHPDLLNRTQLGKNIGRYEFFDYTSNEALHLSCGEIEIYRGVLAMIQQELERGIDKHSRELIVSNIELLLNYCLRFYDRQFITREEINHTVVKKFTDLLDRYIADKADGRGCPLWHTSPTSAATRPNTSANWSRPRPDALPATSSTTGCCAPPNNCSPTRNSASAR